MKRKSPLTPPNLLVSLLAGLFFLLVGRLPAFDLIERDFLDLAFRLRGSELPHSDIVIVEIDDTALQKIGTWPWPRRLHAELLHRLGASSPRVIFYDILFPEASKKEEDESFAREIREAGNVVLPFYFATSDPRRFSEKNAVFPLPIFREAARGLGYVNILPDRDGHVREALLTHFTGENDFSHVALVMASLHKKTAAKSPEVLWSNQKMLINFPGPYENFLRVPYAQVLSDTQSPFFREKVILVGLTAAGTGMDHKPTAFSPLYPGIGVQASILHTILSQIEIRRIPILLHGLALFSFALFILILSAYPHLLRSSFWVLSSLILFFAGSQLGFQYFHIWIPVFSFLSLGSILFLISKLRDFVRLRFERELMTRELALASHIQKSFLTTELPKIPGLDSAALSLPAKEVGGDLYDVIPLGEGRWGFCVGDVSGKGVPAALMMARSLSEFRREARSLPGEVLRTLNEKLLEGTSAGLFLTLLYLVLDPAQRIWRFANAGHEPLLWYQQTSGKALALSTREGRPLGIFPDGTYDEVRQTAEPGDVLLLFSDGVKEATNSRKEMFGLERLKRFLEESHKENAEEIVRGISQAVSRFVGNRPPHDDLTLVCIKFQ